MTPFTERRVEVKLNLSPDLRKHPRTSLNLSSTQYSLLNLASNPTRKFRRQITPSWGPMLFRVERDGLVFIECGPFHYLSPTICPKVYMAPSPPCHVVLHQQQIGNPSPCKATYILLKPP